MLTLITGVPGSGKSLYAVKLILEYVEQNKEYTKKGELDKVREIYTDIDGFDHEKVGTKPIPPSGDWRDTPHGSILFYDECQQKFGPDKNGRSDNPIIADLEIHRHSGHDIFFITQRERLLHSHIRDLIGKHYHIQRISGSHNVKIFSRDETIDTKSISCLNNHCDSQMWRYDKKLFENYKSATVHTHKFKLPNWLKISLLFIILAATITVFAFYKSLGFFKGENHRDIIGVPETQTNQFNLSGNTSLPLINFYNDLLENIDSFPLPEHFHNAQIENIKSIVREPEASILEVSGCYRFRDDCRCLTKNGQIAEYITFNMCLRYIDSPTSSFYINFKENRSGKNGENNKPLTQTEI